MRHLSTAAIVAALVFTLLSAPAVHAQATQPSTPATPTTQPGAGGVFLGVRMGPMDERIAEEIGSDQKTGVIIGEVIPDSPAQKGGLQEQDIIIKIDDADVVELPDLQKVLRASKPGNTHTFTVMRGKETKEVKVTLGTRPANMPAPATRPG